MIYISILVHCSRFVVRFAFAMLFAFASFQAAADINHEVADLVFHDLNDPKATVIVEVDQVMVDEACALPRAFLPRQVTPYSKRITVGFKCASGLERFTQAGLVVESEYPVLKIDIARGTVITPEMIEMRRGPMHQLPRNALREEGDFVGKEAARDLKREEPVQASQFKAVWLVRRNEHVQISAPGAGFSISRSGIALENGALGERVRIKLEDGNQITARVTERKRLIVTL